MDIVVVLFLVAGLFFFTGGAIGILRFPDFYSRLHPAGKLDTLGLLLSLIGLALFNLHHFSLSFWPALLPLTLLLTPASGLGLLPGPRARKGDS